MATKKITLAAGLAGFGVALATSAPCLDDQCHALVAAADELRTDNPSPWSPYATLYVRPLGPNATASGASAIPETL